MDDKDISASLSKLRNLDLNLLTVFEAVYLHKGIVHAAKALNLTPSSVSQSIQKLRNTFPDPLFIRTGQASARRHTRPTCINISAWVSAPF